MEPDLKNIRVNEFLTTLYNCTRVLCPSKCRVRQLYSDIGDLDAQNEICSRNKSNSIISIKKFTELSTNVQAYFDKADFF